MNWDLKKSDPHRFGGKIEDVFIKTLDVYEDDRGFVFESTRIDWCEVCESMKVYPNDYQKIQQVYIVQNKDVAIRAYHVHEKLVDLFCITNGYAKFVLFDDRKESKTYGFIQVINVSDKIPKLIGVPAGVFHGWKGSAGCTLVSVANQLYKGQGRTEKLDEERIPWDAFGHTIWMTEFK